MSRRSIAYAGRRNKERASVVASPWSNLRNAAQRAAHRGTVLAGTAKGASVAIPSRRAASPTRTAFALGVMLHLLRWRTLAMPTK